MTTCDPANLPIDKKSTLRTMTRLYFFPVSFTPRSSRVERSDRQFHGPLPSRPPDPVSPAIPPAKYVYSGEEGIVRR